MPIIGKALRGWTLVLVFGHVVGPWTNAIAPHQLDSKKSPLHGGVQCGAVQVVQIGIRIRTNRCGLFVALRFVQMIPLRRYVVITCQHRAREAGGGDVRNENTGKNSVGSCDSLNFPQSAFIISQCAAAAATEKCIECSEQLDPSP